MTSKKPLFSGHVALLMAGVSLFVAAACVVLSLVKLYSGLYSLAGTVGLVIFFGAVSPFLLYFSTRHRWAVNLYVLGLNVGGFFGFLYFIGVYTPFVLLWTVPLILTFLYCGRIAAFLSALILLAETLFTLFVYQGLIGSSFLTIMILSLMVVVGTVGISYIFGALVINAQIRTERLAESQRAEELQLGRVNSLLNSISDVVLTLNRYGRITSQNAAALSFFDTNQSLVGKSIDAIIELKDATLQPVSIRKMSENLKTTTIRDDVSITDGSDELMRLSVQLSPIHSTFGEDESGSVVIIRDITRQKTLEDEKDEFISVTSHELRTPIAIAEGSLSNLVFMFEKGAKPEQLVASANTAHDQVLYLARMINDLSTLSRAERGVGDVAEEIDANSLLQELYLRYQSEAEAKSLKLNLDLDKLPMITTSRLYLEEILQNFITNAIKYTKEGTVTLSGKVKDGKIECSVSDSGIGISKTDQEKIFDKFFRSEDYRTRETSGTGLGLYVVKKLADKLDTTIEVKSRLNHGSTFSFVLPLKSDKLGTGKRSSA
jgi:two-component system, OmpR family, phosphate regulon sensor histidine kinase PhoR